MLLLIADKTQHLTIKEQKYKKNDEIVNVNVNTVQKRLILLTNSTIQMNKTYIVAIYKLVMNA